jgi:hypothetical protein
VLKITENANKKTIKDLRQRPGVIIGIELTIDVGI